jgi:ParB-like chromosome segregation protein Spo0J
MAASIREFGFKVPILALSDGTIVDGHLRLKAAQKLRIETVPVILCDEWTPAQVKAFRLMANKSVSWAEWDTELLRFEMEDLKSLDFDLELTGFGEEELARILEPAQIEGLTDPDSVPDLPSNPVTVPGDLWILGKHRPLERRPHADDLVADQRQNRRDQDTARNTEARGVHVPADRQSHESGPASLRPFPRIADIRS